LFDVGLDSAVAPAETTHKLNQHGKDFPFVWLIVLQMQIVGEHCSKTITMLFNAHDNLS
jgi:hypothetical protein